MAISCIPQGAFSSIVYATDGILNVHNHEICVSTHMLVLFSYYTRAKCKEHVVCANFHILHARIQIILLEGVQF